MKTVEQENLISIAPELGIAPAFSLLPARALRYIGPVRRATNERVLKQLEKLVEKEPVEEVALFVTSSGGPTGIAMSFFDTIRHVLKPNLVTIGSGDVDSSGIIIFLSGERRFISARTTLLLHKAGRHFGPERYTVRDMEAMIAEDKLKDAQYAALLAERSRGVLAQADVLELMERDTVLSPQELVRFHLADAILP